MGTWEDSDNLIPQELKDRIEFCVREFPEEAQQRRTGIVLSAQYESRSSCLFVYIYDWICVLRLDLHFTVGLTVSKIWPFLRGVFRSISEDIDVDKRDFGETPVMLFALIDAKEAVAKLIERKSIVVEALDERGNGVLHLAVRAGSKSACEVLLRNNARVDALDWSFDRNTPLMIAAMSGDVEIVKLLLEFGANKNIKNSRQKTALQIARKFKNYNCAHLLLTHLR